MENARLELTDSSGQHTIPLAKDVTTIGRRKEHDVVVNAAGVSRDHAEIIRMGDQFVIRDRGSRFGTFVNGKRVSQQRLAPGDRIRLGEATGSAQLVFLSGEVEPLTADRSSAAVADLHQVAVLLEGLRALGSARVLDEVLALVLDSAIEVSRAERGFVMLADAHGMLEFKLARSADRTTLPGHTFETSRKIPEEVFATGAPRVGLDLTQDQGEHPHTRFDLGIRHVSCVPLQLLRYVDRREAPVEPQRIGVLYLDSRETGALLSAGDRAALETLATEAAVAIENARLYRESEEKARLEQELRIAAAIQKALLPPPEWGDSWFRMVGATVPCRAIGGDFYDYLPLPSGDAAFAVADVSGKGAPAALLTAVIQGVLASYASTGAGPAEMLAHVNRVLKRRTVESRFATMFFGVLTRDGWLRYTNAGHNPPFLIQRGRVSRLETGGLILGLFEQAVFDEAVVRLEPGDLLVAFSDGVSEAQSTTGEEFGDDRILECVRRHETGGPDRVLSCLRDAVHAFCAGAQQSDDLTILVAQYLG